MSVYEVGQGLLGEITQIRHFRHIFHIFRFIRTKNLIVRKHTTVVCEAPCKSPCLISLGRDGDHLTKAFLEHYKNLGFKSFIFLDNNSKEECVSHLIDEASALDCDISIYRCNLSYKHFKHSMKNFLVALIPVGTWTFCADSDEFLVLPNGLRDVTQVIDYLEEKEFDTVQYHLLDMFSDKPLHTLTDETEWSLSDLEHHYPYFDISTLRSVQIKESACLQHRGGVRLKHFGVIPLLTKSTFFKKTCETNLRSSHSFLASFTSRPRKVADFTLFAQHFKFNSRYADGLEQAVREKSYYNNSSECRPLFDRFSVDASYTLNTETSLKYQDCEQLLALNFITFSEDFQNHLQTTRKVL